MTMHVAVLGGGLTGLSSAFHLARRFPGARITLLEKSARLGGWVRSDRVTVKSDAGETSVLLEAGPRTLRPNALSVLELIHLLGLTPSLLTVPRTSPAARNRFLHLPGRRGILPIPSSVSSSLTSPLSRVIVPAIFRDALKLRNIHVQTTGETLADESVDSFLTRCFGTEFARTFGSALVHGVYAADARALSVRAAFPVLPDLATRGRGSVIRGMLVKNPRQNIPDDDEYELGEVKDVMDGVSIYSFKDGMTSLVRALEKNLALRENVSIVLGDGVQAMRKTEEGFSIVTTSGVTWKPSHIVSALPLPALSALVENSSELLVSTSSILPSLPHIEQTPTSSVTVVNLVFPGSRALHPPGFGYLVPRPLSGYSPASSGPAEIPPENPLGILGTVFDSCALSGQDTGVPVTKLTVMLGGPYGPVADPHSPRFVSALLGQLATQLGAQGPLPAPLLVRASQHAGCIPTPAVGHERRMAELREAVRRRWGPAEVLGAAVGGVSVGACVEMGKRAGQFWAA